MQNPKNNWYDRFIVKGYTKAKHNIQKPRTVVNQLALYFDVCGWEVPNDPLDPFTGLIPKTRVLYVEEGKNRSHAFKFGEYTTTSTKYPSWHSKAGQEQCPITGYYLSKSNTASVPFTPLKNTDTKYYQLLREWDETKREFLVDTADDTTKLTTETFYIEIRTRGNRKRFYEVTTKIICGNEKIIYPTSRAYHFHIA